MKHRTMWASLACLTLMTVAPAASAQSLVSSADTDDIIRMLGGSKALKQRWNYTPTAAPDANSHACPDVMGSSTPSAGSKTTSRLVPEAVYVSDDEVVGKIDMEILFVSGTDKLSSASTPLLNNLASALKSPKLVQSALALAGHTDKDGEDKPSGKQKNLELSCARAIAVRNYLIGQGVAAERLGAYGFGSDKPLEDKVKSSINRRVEIRRAS